MTEERHNAIRALATGSFESMHGQEDIAILKLAIYELANSFSILELVVTDDDLAEYQIQQR